MAVWCLMRSWALRRAKTGWSGTWRNRTYIYARLQLVTPKSMDFLHVSGLDQMLTAGTSSGKPLGNASCVH
jgi:hypothetical protein